jgi:hypothetical protein
MLDLFIPLAVWRLSSMLSNEDGPFDVFKDIRESAPKNSGIDCLWCVSIWIALPFALIFHFDQFIIYWLAYSAIAILINSINEKLCA